MAETPPRTAQSTLHLLELDQARWQAVLGTARDAIISITHRGIVTLFNRAAEETFGYSADEVLGHNVRMLMPPPYHAEHDRYIESYRATGVAKAIGRIREVEARRKSGEIFPIELSVSEARAGEEVIYSAIIRDVSERKRIDEALRRERDFAERLIETAEAVILVRDTEGRIVLYNPYLERLCGHPLSKMKGEDWFTHFVPAASRQETRDAFLRVLREGEAVGYTTPIAAREGALREIEWHAKVLLDERGMTLGVLAIGQDVTDRNRATKELLEMQKLTHERERLADIGAIAAKMAHDLGNPLSGLSMQAQLILQRARRDADQPLGSVLKPAERLGSEIRRLEALLREFLTFAREQRLELESVELPRFLNDVVELWRPVAAAQRVDLNLDIVELVDAVQVDESKLRRVLDNLVKNAVEAIGEGPGQVRVAVSRGAADKVRISVEDTGCGIAPNVQIFRLFETTKEKGSGLGLAVSKQIVLAHGGDLIFSPRQPRGTVFHVDLPLQRPS